MTTNEQNSQRDISEDRTGQGIREDMARQRLGRVMQRAWIGTRYDNGEAFTRARASTFMNSSVASSKRDLNTRLQRNLKMLNDALDIVKSPEFEPSFPYNSYHCTTPKA